MFDAAINGRRFEDQMSVKWDDLLEMQRKFIEARDTYHKLSRSKFENVSKGLVKAHMAEKHPKVPLGTEVNLHAHWGRDVVCRHCNKQIFDIAYHNTDGLAVAAAQANDWEIVMPKEAKDEQK